MRSEVIGALNELHQKLQSILASGRNVEYPSGWSCSMSDRQLLGFCSLLASTRKDQPNGHQEELHVEPLGIPLLFCEWHYTENIIRTFSAKQMLFAVISEEPGYHVKLIIA